MGHISPNLDEYFSRFSVKTTYNANHVWFYLFIYFCSTSTSSQIYYNLSLTNHLKYHDYIDIMDYYIDVRI